MTSAAQQRLSPTAGCDMSPSSDPVACSRDEIAALCCQTHRSDGVGKFYRRAQLQQGQVICQCSWIVRWMLDGPAHIADHLIKAVRF